MPSQRPTLETISAWVTAINGSLTTLPYVDPPQGAAGENGTPQPLNLQTYSGIWGQHYYQVQQDVLYSMREFFSDVKGDANNRSLPANWRVTIPMTGPNKAKMYRDQVFTGDPQFTVTFPGLRGDTRTELEQQWSAYLNQEIQLEEQASDQSPLDVMKQHCIDYGVGSRYDVLDLSRWPSRPKKRPAETMDEFKQRMDDYEMQRRSTSPFVVRFVHPLNFAYDLTSNPPKWAMLREPIYPWDAAEKYPDWKPSGTLTPAPGVQALVLTEWWTPDWHAVYINGAPALGAKAKADDDGVAPNPYKHIPITFAAGGMGEGDVKNRPEVLLQGLYRRLRPLLLEDAICENIMMLYERSVSFGPKKIIKGPETDLQGQTANDLEADLMAGSYKIARMPNTWGMETVPAPEMPQIITYRWDKLKDDIDAATTYDVAAGAPQSGPAYKMQMQLGQTDKRVGQDVLHLEQAMEQWGKNRLLALKTMLKNEKVGVNFAKQGGATQSVDLDPSRIPDQIQVECNLTSDSASEKARLEQAGLALFQNDPPLIDPETFWREYMKDDDPPGKVAKMLEWEMMRTVGIPALNQLAQTGFQGMVQNVAQQNGQGGLPAGNAGGPGDSMAGAGAPANQPQLTAGPQGAVLPGEPQPDGLMPPNPQVPMAPLASGRVAPMVAGVG